MVVEAGGLREMKKKRREKRSKECVSELLWEMEKREKKSNEEEMESPANSPLFLFLDPLHSQPRNQLPNDLLPVPLHQLPHLLFRNKSVEQRVIVHGGCVS